MGIVAGSRVRANCLFALGIGLLVTSCSDSAAPDPERLLELFADTSAAFRTDRQGYTLRPTAIGYEVSIAFTYSNRTSASVFMVNCNGGVAWQLQKFTGSRWVPSFSPAFPACLSAPIVVPSGGQRSGTAHIYAPTSGDYLHPRFTAAQLPGVYRIVWGGLVRTYTLPSGPWGDELPGSLRASNAFTLKVATR